jgi:putative ABC transport system permease protein
MPATFSHRNGDVYVPLQRQLDPSTRGNHFLVTYARLRKDVSLDRAARDMRALGETLAREYGHNHGIDVRSYNEAIVGRVRTPLQILLGAVVSVLLVACANVANLLLAAGLARRREFAVRLALGARHADIARQLVCEALLLACAGGILGLLAAIWIVRVFAILAANDLPRAATIHPDGRVLAFTAVTSIALGIVCGRSPLVHLRLGAVTDALRESDTRISSSGAAERSTAATA